MGDQQGYIFRARGNSNVLCAALKGDVVRYVEPLVSAQPGTFRDSCDTITALAMAPRHSAVVRITHWITTLSFLGLLVSGVAILLAHPRFYWGETGGLGTPSLIDLPLPFVLVGQTGWGRSLHFLAAWVCVLTGLLYVLSGFFTKHFRERFLSAGGAYNVLQRLAYLVVVFALLSLAIWSGSSPCRPPSRRLSPRW